jgi:hypothetical protein
MVEPMRTEEAAKLAHISTREVLLDREETLSEIANYRAMQLGEEATARTATDPMTVKMAEFKARARPGMIAERQALVDRLDSLLAARGVAISEPPQQIGEMRSEP